MMTIKKESPIGLFRHDITDPKHLAATSIARHHLVNDLLEKLESRGDKKSGLNHLFIGPRGIGKTHLLSLLEQGLNKRDRLKKHYSLIRFPEESNRILSFADLLLGMIDRLADMKEPDIKEPDTEQQMQWRTLHNQLEIEDKDELIIDTILPRLKYWHKQTGKVLIIMLENLDVLLTQQIKNKKDIHRLRRLLMDNSHIVLIATAPTFFPALNDVKHPLYDFFDIQVIEELSQAQTLSLVKAHLEWDNRDDLLQQFTELKPRLLAMHTLTGGNPRLIMMLYELIAEDNLSDIVTRFHQLLDRITPFYQDRIKDLGAQERALLETIALMRSQQRTPVNIAQKFRKPREQTSVLLKRMTQAGYLSVSPNPDDKRSRLYRIKEGLFDIWLAMNESRANRKHLPFLVNFLALWYASQQERENKRQQLTNNLNQLDQHERDNTFKALDYLAEASSEPDEKQQVDLELAVQQIKLGDAKKAKNRLTKIQFPQKIESNGMMQWMQDNVMQWSEAKPEIDAIARIENIINYWQLQRSGELEQVSRLFHELSLDFSSHGLHQLHIALLKERLSEVKQLKLPEKEAYLWLEIASSEKIDGKLSNAQEALNKALEIAINIKNRELEGITLNNLATTVHACGDYEIALKYLEQSLVIQQEIGNKLGVGTTLNNISGIYHARGDYETALKYLEQSLAIQQEIGDKSGLCATLFNMGYIHKQNKAMEDAMNAWLNVYQLAKPMKLAQALDALAELAPQIGLPEGLEGWEALLQQRDNKN